MTNELSGDSDEGDRDSGLIVISVPDGRDQPSERSDAGDWIFQKVITIVKLYYALGSFPYIALNLVALRMKSEAIQRGSVSGEADWGGQTRTAAPQNGQNEPHYHRKRASAVDTTGQEG